MRRLKNRRPSPALLVAIAALCAALVGTAVAGPIANDSRLSRADVKRVVKIARTLALRFDKRFTPPLANREIDKRAPGLSVASAERAESAGSADSAETAGTAESAETAGSAESAETAGSAERAETAGSAERAETARAAFWAFEALAVNGVGTEPIHAFVPREETRTVLNTAGFQIRMTCDATSQVSALVADTSATDAFLLSHSVDGGLGAIENGVSNDIFDSEDNESLIPDGTSDELQFVTYFDDGTGTEFGSRVRASYTVGGDDGSVDSGQGCYAVGTADVLAPREGVVIRR